MKNHHIDAIALFCEDIREEKGGSQTLIGVMGDNIMVPSFPGAMPRLGIYIRLHILTQNSPCKYDIFLCHPNGERGHITTIDEDLVASTMQDAKAAGNKITGIYSQLVAGPFPVTQAGRIRVELVWQEQTRQIGSLNFIEQESSPPPSPTA
jgi:hypothetical protein